MKIYLNGEETVLDKQPTIETFLKEKNLFDSRGIALAINNTVISKNKWNNTKINDKDNLMIITATAGG